MKYILLLSMLLFNAFTYGQNKVDSTWNTYQEFILIDTPLVEIFHYRTDDSVLIVKDSLRTIKWLIDLVIDYMKKDNNIERPYLLEILNDIKLVGTYNSICEGLKSKK